MCWKTCAEKREPKLWAMTMGTSLHRKLISASQTILGRGLWPVARIGVERQPSAARHTQSALRDDVAHHLIGAARELVHGKTAVELLQAPFGRGQRVVLAQGRVRSHDVLCSESDTLVELGDPDFQN